ncbi:RnfABCDGE type electron transport complex subunit D [Bacillus sp. BRMEA1]|uniref:RnfABCDGE type electron transport complex subunit D n=1 Tax=Neobacillus endophyticus TaxID=2738405 RepID=UPI0015658B8C|nr:RnfABCDGE type electron transport complex subunit D [Neobacillus endophyticus]NRD77889.1 RnfABCDGE type electron transport complex subunit D [Neobacillus endophyticus]
MTAKKWLKTPKGYVTILILAYLIIASIFTKSTSGMMNGLIAIGVSLIVDFLFCGITHRKSSKDGTIITGLIIALILSITTPWPFVAGTAALAILSKHLLVYKKKPIFNPAAVGLLISIFLFRSEQSWWGAFGDLPAWLMVLLIIGGYIVTERINKFPQVFSFLGTFFVILFLMGYFHVGDAADALRSPFINAALFFGLFMLTDPPTSPAKYKNQVIFGFITAIAGSIVYAIFGGLTYLFIGLMFGNLYSYWNKRSTSKTAELKQQRIKTAQRAYGK